MVVYELKNGEGGQANPGREGRPTAKLRNTHLRVESVRSYLHFGFCDILTVGCTARRKPLIHKPAPSDEAESDKNCRRQNHCANDKRAKCIHEQA